MAFADKGQRESILEKKIGQSKGQHWCSWKKMRDRDSHSSEKDQPTTTERPDENRQNGAKSCRMRHRKEKNFQGGLKGKWYGRNNTMEVEVAYYNREKR